MIEWQPYMVMSISACMPAIWAHSRYMTHLMGSMTKTVECMRLEHRGPTIRRTRLPMRCHVHLATATQSIMTPCGPHRICMDWPVAFNIVLKYGCHCPNLSLGSVSIGSISMRWPGTRFLARSSDGRLWRSAEASYC